MSIVKCKTVRNLQFTACLNMRHYLGNVIPDISHGNRDGIIYEI